MAKLLLLSVLGATILLPAVMASDPNPKRGLQRTVLGMVIYIVVWAFACAFIYPRLP